MGDTVVIVTATRRTDMFVDEIHVFAPAPGSSPHRLVNCPQGFQEHIRCNRVVLVVLHDVIRDLHQNCRQGMGRRTSAVPIMKFVEQTLKCRQGNRIIHLAVKVIPGDESTLYRVRPAL